MAPGDNKWRPELGVRPPQYFGQDLGVGDTKYFALSFRLHVSMITRTALLTRSPQTALPRPQSRHRQQRQQRTLVPRPQPQRPRFSPFRHPLGRHRGPALRIRVHFAVSGLGVRPLQSLVVSQELARSARCQQLALLPERRGWTDAWGSGTFLAARAAKDPVRHRWVYERDGAVVYCSSPPAVTPA